MKTRVLLLTLILCEIFANDVSRSWHVGRRLKGDVLLFSDNMKNRSSYSTGYSKYARVKYPHYHEKSHFNITYIEYVDHESYKSKVMLLGGDFAEKGVLIEVKPHSLGNINGDLKIYGLYSGCLNK